MMEPQHVEPVIGIIYPPPELRNIVDKTAGFVARNGPDFEARIQKNEQNNPKFNFLKSGDPYNSYYRFKVQKGKEELANPSLAEAREAEEDATKAAAEADANGNLPTVEDGDQPSEQEQLVPMTQGLYIKKVKFLLGEAPPPFEFMDDPPTLDSHQLSILRLTAQFVALHGRGFLVQLTQKESRNAMYDFTRPQHGLFPYFNRMIEQYRKVCDNNTDVVTQLSLDLEDETRLQDRVRHRMEWEKVAEKERKRNMEEAEMERAAFNQIDWHDFVIVETVDYQPKEAGTFPPPTTPEQVGQRILLEQRASHVTTGPQHIFTEDTTEPDDMEMDMGSDEEEETSKKEEPPPMVVPLPPSLENVNIRKDYKPKGPSAPTVPDPESLPQNYVISPLTGEKIPASKLEDHMRYGLLDPAWRQVQERAIHDKRNEEEVFASTDTIESSLKNLAERRTDIFGGEEVSIGRKYGEAEKKAEKPTWDGSRKSATTVMQAVNSTITQQERIHNMKERAGLIPDPTKERIGPQSTSGNPLIPNPPSQQQHQPRFNTNQGKMQPPQVPQFMLGIRPPMVPGFPLGMDQGQPGFPGMGQHFNANQQPPPSTMNQMPMMNQMQHHNVPPPFQQQPPPPQVPLPVPHPMSGTGGPGSDDFNAKRLKVDAPPPPIQVVGQSFGSAGPTNLVPEEDFVRNLPAIFSVSVVCPMQEAHKEWRLLGQTMSINIGAREEIGNLKQKIADETGVPVGKQKLQYDGTFLKDNVSFAHYNINPGSFIHLVIKERGGRR